MQALCLLMLTCSQAPAKKPITPELLYSNTVFLPPAPTLTWLPDGKHWLETKGDVLHTVDALSGASEPAFDVEAFRKSLESVPGLDKDRVKSLIRGSGLRADADRTGTLVSVEDGLYFAPFSGAKATKLTGTDAELITFAPNGKAIAFVRGGNLFSVDVATQKQTQLTSDGGGDILNGKADWVYEEEIFNRNGQAYWWSPDSQSLAFLRFDDGPVKKFTIVKASGEPEIYGYPKPGDPNPTVKLFTVKPGEKPVELLIAGDPKDTLVSRVGWTPKGDVFAYVQNRVQTWLDFTVWHDARPSVLFRDKTEAWIDDAGAPVFLPDGESFLILSEREGRKKVYHYSIGTDITRHVPSEDGEVKELLGVRGETLLYLSNDKNLNGTVLKKFNLANGTVQSSADSGTHTIQLAPQGDLFIDRFSSPTVPPTVNLSSLTLKNIRKLETPTLKKMDEYTWGKYERVKFDIGEGKLLQGAITYPPDFDENKKYPVWMLTYAGPQNATIKDTWSTRLFEQVLANMGIVVFRVDPRPANGHGVKYSWPTYKKLGVEELKDLEAAALWIGGRKWCDESRIGLSGHSFGGYITAYALTHSKKWSAGIAGAPVTDWRLYDSIYTERYMGLPSENKAGYDESSCILAAKNLHGKLLIIHGLIDDNVHFQNAMQFADALQKANKPFEMMVYPNARHPIHGRHYWETQIEFIRRTMLK